MSREAREQRDFDLLPKAKKRRLKEAADGKRVEKKDDEPSKPGRKGFVMRARVPMPSNQDYVVRPKVSFFKYLKSSKLIQWNIDGQSSDDDDEEGSNKRRKKPRNQIKKKSNAEERMDRQIKRQIDLKRAKRVSKGRRGVNFLDYFNLFRKLCF